MNQSIEPKPSTILICGSTMSGKTTLLKKLLKEQLLAYHDYIYIFSPTINLSLDFEEFKENSTIEEGRVLRKFSNPTEFKTHIKSIYQQQEDLFKNYGKKEVPNVLCILDDAINEKLLSPNGYISKMSISSRHYNVSLVILSQRIAAIPRQIRINAKYVFLFSSSNFSELQRFLDEFVPKRYKKNFENKLIDIFNEPYNYILCKCFEPKLKERLYLNGNELLHFE